MNSEIQPYSEQPQLDEEGFGYHIVDNTKRPLFTEEDLLRDNLEGNYVLITGQNPQFVGVKVEKPSELQEIIGRISLADSRHRVGLESELSPEEEAILNDPNSMRGANIDYVSRRANFLLESRSGQIDRRSSQGSTGLIGKIIKRLKGSEL